MKVLMKNFHGLERTSCTPMKSSTYIMNDTPTNPVLLRKLDQYARCFIFFFSFFHFFYFVKANSSLSNIHSDKTYRITLLGPYTERIRSLFSLIISSSTHFISLIPPRLSNLVTFKLILLTFTQILNQENFYYIQTKHSNDKSKKPLFFPSLSFCLFTHLTTFIFSVGQRRARDFIPLGFPLEQEMDGTISPGHSLM